MPPIPLNRAAMSHIPATEATLIAASVTVYNAKLLKSFRSHMTSMRPYTDQRPIILLATKHHQPLPVLLPDVNRRQPQQNAPGDLQEQHPPHVFSDADVKGKRRRRHGGEGQPLEGLPDAERQQMQRDQCP